MCRRRSSSCCGRRTAHRELSRTWAGRSGPISRPMISLPRSPCHPDLLQQPIHWSLRRSAIARSWPGVQRASVCGSPRSCQPARHAIRPKTSRRTAAVLPRRPGRLGSANDAYQRIDVTAQFLCQPALALDVAQGRYNLGLSSIVELTQAQLNRPMPRSKI